MQATSRAYKTEQASDIRNESYVWVYLGVINREAQRSGDANGTFTDYSKEQEIFNNNAFEGYYATFEENQTLVDGSMYFMPRNRSAVALYQGAVTENFLAPITIRFGTYRHLNLKGLTIDFGRYYPTRFTISNGQYTYTYTHDKPDEKWVEEEDEWLDTEYLTITPLEMVGGNQRFRIMSILMGVGFVFDNHSLVSTTRKNSVSHLSDCLPKKTFDFTVQNYNRKFSADNPHSFVSFLQTEQRVEYDYGRKLDDGTIFRIPGGVTSLKAWSSNDSEAKFSTVGMLDFRDGTYIKGQVSAQGRSLYDLAVDVCEDAGFEDYQIDTYLKTIYTHNPLPVAKHKELLQLIANAGMCIMYEDRKGRVTIQSSFVPEIESISTDDATAYSDISDLFDDEVIVSSYGSFERDFTKVTGTQFFLPRNGNYLSTGFVSTQISNANGEFSDNPKLTFVYEAKWNFFSLAFLFQDTIPEEFIVRGYGDNELVCQYKVEDIDFTTVINEEFLGVDTVEVEFTKTQPYQRIHLGKIRTGSQTDYTIDYRDMSSTPAATTTEFVKDVNVHYFEYGAGTERKKINTVQAIAGSNTTTFSKACYSYSLSYKDGGSGTLSIVESGAYYITFTSSRAAEVEISAIEYQIADSISTVGLRETGVDKTSKNALIDNADLAQRNAEWLKEHFSNDMEYQIYYRGEPAIDCDDQIYLENKFVIKNLVRVTEEQIDTSQGMSMRCSIKARRISYKEVSRVNYAIVNVSEVVGA